MSRRLNSNQGNFLQRITGHFPFRKATSILLALSFIFSPLVTLADETIPATQGTSEESSIQDSSSESVTSDEETDPSSLPAEGTDESVKVPPEEPSSLSSGVDPTQIPPATPLDSQSLQRALQPDQTTGAE